MIGLLDAARVFSYYKLHHYRKHFCGFLISYPNNELLLVTCNLIIWWLEISNFPTEIKLSLSHPTHFIEGTYGSFRTDHLDPLPITGSLGTFTCYPWSIHSLRNGTDTRIEGSIINDDNDNISTCFPIMQDTMRNKIYLRTGMYMRYDNRLRLIYRRGLLIGHEKVQS